MNNQSLFLYFISDCLLKLCAVYDPFVIISRMHEKHLFLESRRPVRQTY